MTYEQKPPVVPPPPEPNLDTPETPTIPKTDEEKFCIVPPQKNRDFNEWKDKNVQNETSEECDEEQLDIIRRRLEDLL